jgi:hypothetical protein
MSRTIFASQGLQFGSAFSPPLADLEYILRIHALIFHWLRLPVHVSNRKTLIMSIPIMFRLFRVLTFDMLGRLLPVFTLLLWQRQHILVIDWKHLSHLPKLWNFHLVDSKCFQIKFTTNKFLFTGRCHFQLSNIRITKRFWLAYIYIQWH